MFYKFLTLFRIFLYSEPSFFIKKITANTYFVQAKNGLNADITITERCMFVKAWSDVDYVAFYYCTPMQSSEHSFDQFVIDNIKNSIVFTLPTKQLNSYLGMHSQFFARFSTSKFPVLFLGGNISSKNLKDDEYTYDFNRLNGTYYPIIYFTKKKIIKNIFRYNLTAIKNDNKSTVQNIAYTVAGSLFYLSNTSSFYSSKTISSVVPKISTWFINANPYNINNKNDKKIGFENQLFEHKQTVSKYLNADKVWLLMNDDKEFCLLNKYKRKLMLSYLPPKTIYEEKNNNLIMLTYYKGKVKIKKTITIRDEIKNHEMSISNTVMDKIESLKLKKPSEAILQSLRELELSTKIPLNNDDLIVLDMCNI